MINSILDFSFGYSHNIHISMKIHTRSSTSKNLQPMLDVYDLFKENLKDGLVPETFFTNKKAPYRRIDKMLQENKFKRDT